MKNYMIAIIVLIIVVIGLSIFQSIQISSIKNNIGNGVTGNVIDMTGWTEQEKMMYEHHGTLPSRVKGSQSPSSGMVGGC